MKKKTRGWLTRLFIFFFSVFLVWFLVFLVWLFWADLKRLVKGEGKKSATEQTQEPSQEKISEQDRRQLEEILKKRK
ncbi:MAG: hypothetical protein HY694_01850 [Deltaproteobacteria bacterium]|nr:hypothetical protein [Deltaproteobacteria bacterium]